MNIVLEIDQRYLDKVLLNILSNAFKYTPENGKVMVRSNYDPIAGKYHISVKDSGVGISSDMINDIFNRLEQKDDSTDEKYRVTGMGLSLARKIIRLHEGNITVNSKFGEGTTFNIELPVHRNTETDESPDDRKRTDFKNMEYEDDNYRDFEKTKNTLLIVEDNKDMRLFLRNNLKRDYNIYTVINGKKALQKLKTINKPELILADIMMPEMDGWELFRNLAANEEYMNVPFIFLTAKASFKERLAGLKEGAVDYIYKPFTMDELELKISNFIKRDKLIKKTVIKKIQKDIHTVIEDSLKSSKVKSFCKVSLKMCREYNITIREKQVIEYLIQGFQAKMISTALNISKRTVSKHIENIFLKFKVDNRVELVNELLSWQTIHS